MTPRRIALVLAAAALAAALLAALVVTLGLVPIRASSDHWPITAWMLDFTKQRSVATYSMGITAPELDDPALVRRGARVYDSICRTCHGSPDAPGFPVPRVPAAMTPHPPNLDETVARWDPEELFAIVKHGIKFTGMPAWTARDRDDEIWPIVAFLRRYPGMTAAEYASLTAPAADAAEARRLLDRGAPMLVVTTCRRCHGIDGFGFGVFPRLAGQQPEYLRAALAAYQADRRPSGVMGPIAAALRDAERDEVVAYFAGLPPATSGSGPAGIARAGGDNASLDGASIARNGVPAARVPACVDCHGLRASENPAYPTLAGQPADYLVRQIELFKSRHRGGSKYAHLMFPVADTLTDDAMRAVAAYYASLTASR